jgi:hypothetical protein
MKNMEHEMNDVKLRAPSPVLDERLDGLLAQGHDMSPPWWAQPIRLWHCAAACILCFAIGALTHSATIKTPEPTTIERTVYFVPADSATLTRMFDVTQREYPFGMSQPAVTITNATANNGV